MSVCVSTVIASYLVSLHLLSLLLCALLIYFVISSVQRPVAVVKLILGFVLKLAVFWPWLAKDLFFSQSLEQSTLRR